MYIVNKHLKQICIVIIATMLYSCAESQKDDAVLRVEICESDEAIYAADMVDTVSLVALKENDACMVGEIKKIEETGEHYFVMNQKKNMIARFSKDGEFVDKLQRVGRSKSEYIEINDFSVDEESGMLVLLCDYTKVMVCDLSFNRKKIYTLDTPLERVCVFGSRIYGYSSLDNNVVSVSEEGTRDVVQGIKLASWVYSQSQVFFKSDGAMLVAMECDNTIYRIDEDGVGKYMSFTYDDYHKIMDKYKDEGKRDGDGLFPAVSPVRVKNLSLKDDTLKMIYSKDFLVRCSSVDVRNRNLIYDGVFIGSPSPAWNGERGCVLAETFADGTGLPIDSGYLNKLDSPFGDSLSDPVVVKYRY